MPTYALDTTWRPLLKDLGVPLGPVLRRAGLPEGLIDQPGRRLPAADFHRFWESLFEHWADPLAPITLCKALRAEAFSPLLFAALCSPNLRVALQRVARYKPLVAPMALHLREERRALALVLVWPDNERQPPASLAVTELLFMVSLARMGTREPLRPTLVATPTPPQAGQAYTDFLGVPITRGKQHEVRFTLADAQRPFLTADEDLWKLFEPSLKARLAQVESGVSTALRVRAALQAALPAGQAHIEAVAARLAMSPRSLQRRLQLEGLSYQKVLQDTRLSLARHYLQHTPMGVAEIAFLLGFEEANSFYRAFRLWTGLTPAEARRMLATRVGRRHVPHAPAS